MVASAAAFRLHAEVLREAMGYVLYDRVSRNGTLVNADGRGFDGNANRRGPNSHPLNNPTPDSAGETVRNVEPRAYFAIPLPRKDRAQYPPNCAVTTRPFIRSVPPARSSTGSAK